MKNRLVTTLPMALLLAATGLGALAQDAAPKTRAQVRQELEDAIRDGTMPFGESGKTMREMFPSRYPRRPATNAAMPATLPASMPAETGAPVRAAGNAR